MRELQLALAGRLFLLHLLPQALQLGRFRAVEAPSLVLEQTLDALEAAAELGVSPRSAASGSWPR